MADAAKDKKIKLANSRKKFKELQELKKKRNAGQNILSPTQLSIKESTRDESMTSSTHSSLTNDHAEKDVTDNCTENQLTNYFSNSNYGASFHQNPVLFFDSFLQDRGGNIEKNDNTGTAFNLPSSPQTFVDNMVSNVVATPLIENPMNDYAPNYSFSQGKEATYVREEQNQRLITPDAVALDDPEIEQNEIYNIHNSSVDMFSSKDNQKINYLDDSRETINNDTNVENEITNNSNLAQAEVQHSSIESLKQLSNEMAQLIEPDYLQSSNSITDLEKRNLELAAQVEQEKLKTEQQKQIINDLQTSLFEFESKNKAAEEHSNLLMSSEMGKLKEELQYHIQTVGLLVAEKTELSANLSQVELKIKQKNAECEELQTRLKASRSRVADLERDVNFLSSEKSKIVNAEKGHNEYISKLKKDYDTVKEQNEEIFHDLLEVREKLKNSSEENLKVQQQNQELSSKLSFANMKIQQITNGEQSTTGDNVEKLTQEKFEMEKQLSNLNLMLKTITKERDESSAQYQQYAQQLNSQITNLSSYIEQLQQENENLCVQEQNRIKHIGELEKQLQNLQNEQVSYVLNRNNGDVNLNIELDNLRELCVQLQVEKTAAEDNVTKALNEKEMLIKELQAKNDSLSQLESMVEQLRGNQPDSVKLLATMESDKVAAARAVLQNKELKQQLESMQEVFTKLDKDKVELTDQLNIERISNKELLEKLQKVELQLQRLTDAIEIKDRELSALRQTSAEHNKMVLHQEHLTDRLRHYEAQDNSSFSLQDELQEAKQIIIKLTNEVNVLKNKKDISKKNNGVEENIHREMQTGNGQEEPATNYDDSEKNQMKTNKVNSDINENNSLDKDSAMRCLEDKFKKLILDVADLTEEKQRLEHLVLQLQGETETIGEYVALYQQQRMLLKQRAIEKDQQLKQLASDREQIKIKLEKLNELICQLVAEKGEVPHELLIQHKNITREIEINSKDTQQIQQDENIYNTGQAEPNIKNHETAERIMELLSEIKSSNLVQSENFHHCPWCSGQLITV